MTSLFCAACKEELAPNATNSAILGIGYLEAAINLEAILNSDSNITELIFTGTAGAYSPELETGAVLEVGSAGLLNLGIVQELSYSPIDYPIFQSSQTSDVLCLSSLEITQDEKISEKIIEHYKTNQLVENMELYGIAQVANKYNLPWSAQVKITNYTNKNAHQDWLINRDHAYEQQSY